MALSVGVISSISAAWGFAAPPDTSPTRVAVARSDAARDCPDADAMVATVNRITRSAAVAAARPEDTPGIVVTLDRDSDGYRARIEATIPIAGVREISDPGSACLELASALAVTIALLVDPTSAGTEVAQTGTGGAEHSAGAGGIAAEAARLPVVGVEGGAAGSGGAPPVRATPPASAGAVDGRGERAPRDEPSALRGSAVAFDVEVGAGVALGITFPLAPAAWLGLGARLGPWRGELGALWLPRQERSVGSVQVQLDLWAARLRLCRELWAIHGDWPGGGACLHGVGGVLSARARDVDDASPARVSWVGGGAGLGVTGRIRGPLAWRIEASALRPLFYSRFQVRGQGELVYDPPWVVGLVGATLEVSNW